MGTQKILTIWMLIFSLQMITHTILLQSMMPQDLFLYLKNLLNILRLKSAEEDSDLQALNMYF